LVELLDGEERIALVEAHFGHAARATIDAARRPGSSVP
jgi:hypothetical protein